MLKFYYFPKVPLESFRPAGITMDSPKLLDPKFAVTKFKDWKIQHKKNILQEISKNGQLDPNVVLWDGNSWRIEPGQTRWIAMYKLNISTQKMIAIVEDNSQQYFNILEEYEHTQITTKQDLEACFLFSKWEDHHGLGFFRRRYSKYFE